MTSQEIVQAIDRREPKPDGIAVAIQVHIQPGELDVLDAWISRQDRDLTRPEAISQLIQIGAHCQPYVRALLNHLEEASQLEHDQIHVTVEALRKALGQADSV